MTAKEMLSERRQALTQIVQSCLSNATAHSIGFVGRILSDVLPESQLVTASGSIPLSPESIQYAGYPSVAFLGFKLGLKENPIEEEIQAFITGLARLKCRSEASLNRFASDDVAILGVADGLIHLRHFRKIDVSETIDWFLNLIDYSAQSELWSFRMRALAGDLLDRRGRLRLEPDLSQVDGAALETVLRAVWQHAFTEDLGISREVKSQVLKRLLVEPVPQSGDLERAAVWLKALDIIIEHSCETLLPTISDTARILERVQHSLKRWVWTSDRRRKNALPSRWLIDNEYDVQSLLWAVLYPVYGPDLVDETYLPNWGFVQPRADLGIVTLKLIIEVKFAREPKDFKEIEGEIGNDLGLYFKDESQFDRMIVFVYDDCDTPHTEKYDSLKNALKKRERIEDVIIVRRPGILPDRNCRNN